MALAGAYYGFKKNDPSISISHCFLDKLAKPFYNLFVEYHSNSLFLVDYIKEDCIICNTPYERLYGIELVSNENIQKHINTEKIKELIRDTKEGEGLIPPLFPSDEIIITFYSDRNLNERMEFKNSLIFSSLAKFGSSLKEELKRLKENFEIIVVDTSGRDTKDTRMVMILSDIIVIPAIPSQFDVVVLEHMLEIFNEVKEINESVKGFVLPNRVSPNPFLSKELLNLIQYIKELIKEKELEDFKLLKSIIYERQAYRKAILDGKTLDELCSKNDKALLDFDMFFKELQNEIRR